jgi:hypothetical protein
LKQQIASLSLSLLKKGVEDGAHFFLLVDAGQLLDHDLQHQLCPGHGSLAGSERIAKNGSLLLEAPEEDGAQKAMMKSFWFNSMNSKHLNSFALTTLVRKFCIFSREIFFSFLSPEMEKK